MAARVCCVVVLFTIVVISILESSYAFKNDVEYYRYSLGLQDNDREVIDDWTGKYHLRLRRDAADGDGAKDDADKKTTTPTKDIKGDKPPPITKKKPILTLKKDISAKKTSGTTTTTSSTSITTTTTTTTMSPGMPLTDEAAPDSSNTTSTTTTGPTTSAPTTVSPANTEPESNQDENRTSGMMSSKSQPEESGDDTDLLEPIMMQTDPPTIEAEELDPDSGDDIVAQIDGFDTDNTTIDHHRYYKSMTYAGMGDTRQFWVDLNTSDHVVTNEMLSTSHRRAVTVTLTFDFPFYGHMLRNITIATGGFLFTGDYVHTWLAATQYIAPLMANFDTSLSKNANVRYADNGTSFTVQWNDVLLKDHKNAGSFTFQVTLHKSGDIIFTYKAIPLIVTSILDDQHPVKVGLSDAYIVDRTIFYVRRKTIYEYHKIDMKKESVIGNWTAIVFRALPTCVALITCEACLSVDIMFECQWCNKIGRCSNGLDRYRQEWLNNGCEQHGVQHSGECAALPPVPSSTPNPYSPPSPTVDTFGHDARVEPASRDGDEAVSSVGVVVGVVFLMALVLGIGGWIGYAYFYPHSPSGQVLIRYRPSAWSWKRGEARYTAAAIHSIHM